MREHEEARFARTWHRAALACAGALLVAALSGCTSDSADETTTATDAVTSAEAERTVVGGWFQSDATSAWYVSIDEEPDGSLSGTVYFAELAPDGLEVVEREWPVAGFVDGDRVELIDVDQTWSGSFTDDTLTVTVTSPGAEPIDLALTRSEPIKFNGAVRVLNRTVDANRTTTT